MTLPVPPVPGNNPPPSIDPTPQPGPWAIKFVMFVQNNWKTFAVILTAIGTLYTAYQHEFVTAPIVAKNKDAIVNTKEEVKKIQTDVYQQTPNPPPPIPKDGKKEPKTFKTAHITFVTDKTPPADVLAVLNDDALGKYLQENRIAGYVVFNTVQSDVADKVREANLKNAVVLQDAAGNVLGVQAITTAEAVKAFLK